MKKEKLIKLYRSNSFYHVYNRGNNKMRIFIEPCDFLLFKGLMYRYAKKEDIAVISYCYMPNHFHFVFLIKDDLESVPRFMRAYMTAYVMYFNRKYQRVGHLLQGPFQARRIKDRRDLNSVIEYIKKNPEEAGLVNPKKGEKYKWLFVKKAYDTEEV